jgi:hypothetical protein
MNLKTVLLDFAIRLTSRKFLALLGLGLLLLADNAGLKIEPQIRNQLVVLVVAYIAAEGTADAVARYSPSKE